MTHLLIAEDEPELAQAVCAILQHAKYTVSIAPDGQAALDMALCGAFGGILLDVMMPQKNGFEVLTALRQAGLDTPVLMLTAKSQADDKISGLDAGADDYLTKPFHMGELLARVRAMLRRPVQTMPETLVVGDLTLERTAQVLSGTDASVRLDGKELKLLEFFLQNPNTLLKAEQILERVWDISTDVDGVIWIYMSYLSKKLDSVGTRAVLCQTDDGYVLEVLPHA